MFNCVFYKGVFIYFNVFFSYVEKCEGINILISSQMYIIKNKHIIHKRNCPKSNVHKINTQRLYKCSNEEAWVMKLQLLLVFERSQEITGGCKFLTLL